MESKSKVIREIINFSGIRIFLLSGFILGLHSCQESADHTRSANRSLAQVDLAIQQAYLVTMDSAWSVYPSATILIKDGVIERIGPEDSLRGSYRAIETWNAQGRLILPGLINTHTHAAMTLLRGLADDLPLQEWLENYIWPTEAQFMDSSAIMIGTRLAMAEMIRGGTTTFCDMYFFEDGIAQEVDRAGMRALLGEGILGFPTPSAQVPQEAIARTERMIRVFGDHPRITPIFAPHSPYTCDASVLEQCQSLVKQYQVPLTIHVAETQTEDALIRDQKGMSPTAYLHQQGILADQTIAAHGVVLTPEDMQLLAQTSTGIAHCPQSNLKLASGIAAVPALRQAGVEVGLGTDGASSNNSLDLFEEMSLAARLHKVTAEDPSVLPARQVLAMATIEGAEVLGIAD
ncbi:MAG: amidohydrolase, partial [Bacteroidota bacterium]